MHTQQRFIDRIDQEITSSEKTIKIKDIEHAKQLYVLQATADAEYEDLS